MNTRLTPELECRIRQGLLHQWEEGETAISALLAELDAVRQQLWASERLRELIPEENEKLESQVEALSRKVKLADAALRETAHELDCRIAKDQIGCTCGATDNFKPKRAEFYKALREQS